VPAHEDQVIKDKQWHSLRLWRRHSGYTTPVGFGGFSLKTMGSRLASFGPQNLGKDLGAACGMIRELRSC